ncbi:hypothetical protein Y1Q_0023115 [Alligator mississippiensis]|uniref:Ig-like domain-containing protein n=1 Tax=Alligator mississippiensis TaxID=8496 RepID=A0A151MPD9_ALLMI|nr:hypothetical protein Y1Q_0023115 [Alligator mississippiensis]
MVVTLIGVSSLPERPVAQVSNKPSSPGGHTISSCWVHGFYPENISGVWLKNGEAQHTCSVALVSLGAALRVAWDKSRTGSSSGSNTGIKVSLSVSLLGEVLEDPVPGGFECVLTALCYQFLVVELEFT